MQYSVQQILAVKDLYKDPPFVGFSLDEVCRRKKVSTHGPLKRGDNAWCVKQIVDANNGVSRKVQSALNKLAPEKYEEVVKDLKVADYICTEALREIVVDLIFNKALIEPGYAEMYARLCYDIARYEISLPGLTEADKKKSKFRDTIIRRAQREFQSDVSVLDGLSGSGDDREDAVARLVRKKRANIKFIGQLFMQKVLSQQIMMTIVQEILKTERVVALLGDAAAAAAAAASNGAAAGGGGSPQSPSSSGSSAAPAGPSPKVDMFIPNSINIEVLAELLETTGRTLDQAPDVRKVLNLHFDKIRTLSKGDPKETGYESRTKFKLMNLVELREWAWDPRITRADTQAPTTLQEQEAKQQQKQQQQVMSLTSTVRSPVATPNSRHSNRRFPATQTFPDSPVAGGAAPPATPPVSTGWRNVRAPQARDTPAYTPHSPITMAGPSFAYGPEVPLEKRLKDLRLGWNGETAVPAGWMGRFKSLEDAGTDDDLLRAIVVSVVREACTTTRQNAQLEASRFLLLGLEMDESLLCGGLSLCLTTAIEEGIMEDSPKFNERYVTILHTTTMKETVEELYCDAAKLLYVTCHALINREEDAIAWEEIKPNVQDIWNNLPVPGTGALQSFVVQCVVDLREDGEGQSDVAAALLVGLLRRQLASPEDVKEWLGSRSAAQAEQVAQAMEAYLASGEK